MWYELSRWASYRRIKHPQMKWYVWILPGGIAGIITFGYVLWPNTPSLLGNDGLIRTTISLVSLLPGFFVAALAAVATFDRSGLDEEMEQPSATMLMRVKGKMVEITLSNRLFLTSLFSYLTATSFGLLLLGWFALMFAPGLKVILFHINTEFSPYMVVVSSGFFVLVFMYLFSSLVVSGLHGLYFLAERIHRPLGS